MCKVFNNGTSEKNRKILIGNFDCENHWRDRYSMRLPQIDIRKTQTIIQSLDEMFMFLGNHDDVIVLRQEPNKLFIEYLLNLGIELPKVYVLSSQNEKMSTGELLLNDSFLLEQLKQYVETNSMHNIRTYLFPYGITKFEEEICKRTSAILPSSNKISCYLNNKLNLIKLRNKYKLPSPKHIVCKGKEDLKESGVEFIQNNGCVALKEPFGSGGSGLLIMDNEIQYNQLLRIICKSNISVQKLIIEKWYSHHLSFNYQYAICDDGIYQYTHSKQLIDSKGKIVGSEFEFAQEPYIELSYKYTNKLVNHFFDIGYRGIIGFDGLKCSDGKILPVIDINCRINLSTIFYEIIRRYFPCEYAIFFYKEYFNKNFINFNWILEQLGEHAFSLFKREGILILNFETLNINKKYNNGNYGRIFYAIIAHDKEQAAKIYKEVFSKDLEEV